MSTDFGFYPRTGWKGVTRKDNYMGIFKFIRVNRAAMLRLFCGK
jgi:hypothetical protein